MPLDVRPPAIGSVVDGNNALFIRLRGLDDDWRLIEGHLMPASKWVKQRHQEQQERACA
jgi:hypothetical protein